MSSHATSIRVGIVGGAGYTAGELLRILLYHPDVTIDYVQSSSHAGQPISAVHRDLEGECHLVFTESASRDVAVIFLCSGHGKSAAFLSTQPMPESLKIIDLSQDFRVGAAGFIYGLPELNREALRKATKIANPGCFATAIQLALLPLAKAHMIGDAVHISAVTGSTGAGQLPSPSTHFSWRSNNISVYKPFQHQHLAEIQDSLKRLQPGFDHPLQFIPYRGCFTRGILATVYLACEWSLETALANYRGYYAGHPFVKITQANPSVKQVVNTNNAVLYLEKHGGVLLIVSAIDNLVKGASGQAVQNMNLAFGLDETAGLRLKPVAF